MFEFDSEGKESSLFWGAKADGLAKDLTLESQIILNKFKPRDYQQPIYDAFFRDRFKRMVLVLPRRSGKDLLTWNMLIREAITVPGVYYIVYPTYSQGKKILWNSVTNDGDRFLDYIPEELIVHLNGQEMRINLSNGSIIQIIGSDNPDRIVGTNPRGVVFSEYALQNPRIWALMSPIITANQGWVIFQSTPRGHNSFYDLYNLAEASKYWYCCKMGLDETQHVPESEIQKEINEGLMSPDLVQQEWYCSFDAGVEGSIYGKYVDRMVLNHQMTLVPWESEFPVHTACDLGMTDPTCIIFFQIVGKIVKIIDFYSKQNGSLEEFIRVMNSKPYTYGTHIAPFDIMVKEQTTGMTRKEKAAQLGVDYEIAPGPSKISRWDGIEAVRSLTSKLWIDEERCAGLVKAMENYRKEYNPNTQRYREVPRHDKYSDPCFAGDTKVLTENGYVKIKDIKVGDNILTPLGKRKVLKVLVKKPTNLYKVSIGNKKIKCTGNHRFFTNRGLVRADELRYTDNIECYNKLRVYLWKKIYTYFFAEHDSRGFKKIISSLRTDYKSCLMGTFIGGMDHIIREEFANDRTAASMDSQVYQGMYGHTTMVKSLRTWLYIIKMKTLEIIQSTTLRYSTKANTSDTTPPNLDAGVNLKPVKNHSDLKTQKLQYGTRAQRDLPGTRNKASASREEVLRQNTKENVMYAKRSSMPNKHGENTVRYIAKTKEESLTGSISKVGFALYAKVSSFVTNTLLRKHAVKNVRQIYSNIPEEVYDLTVQKDNCYYVEGYLVSNCDALRYLAISYKTIGTEITPEYLNRAYIEATQGKQNFPEPFRSDNDNLEPIIKSPFEEEW